MTELIKRTWVYAQSPTFYEIRCDLCGRTNVTWSEYIHHIWCYDCQKDTKGTQGLLNTPIQTQVAAMLGVSFDRVMLSNDEYQKYDLKQHCWLHPDNTKAEDGTL